MHLQRLHPDMSFATPALILLIGVLLSMASVSWLINRYPPERRLGFLRVYERIASRDYIYLVMALTAVERLEWFVWSAAIGAHLFWISLWWGARPPRAR